jgi:2-oxoisovalerate dehydrogenase E1 component
MGHSRGDPPHGIYRTEEELSAWLRRDPLEIYSREAELSAEERSNADQVVATLIDNAVAFARSSPAPAPEEALTDVWGP